VTDTLDGPHWHFALTLYDQPGVAEACLRLQDRLGVDVNILLFSVYAATEHRLSLDAHDVRSMNDIVASWRREVVAALREVRRRLKSGPQPAPNTVTETLRAQIKGAELRAEQIEQAVLADWLERGHGPGQTTSEVDIGGTLQTVVAFFAGVHAAPTGATETGEVRTAMETLRTAALNTHSRGLRPAKPDGAG
jgi:uncharacterized protein (TIGR02444 family)